MTTLYFLGGGNMANAIIGTLYQQPNSPHIHVINRGKTKRQQLAQLYPKISTSCSVPNIQQQDIIILAVKPQDMHQACAELQHNGALILSVAAGLSTATLSHYLNGAQRIIRIMPNTPSRVGLGIAGLYANTHISAQDRQTAQNIMQACGQTIWLDKEEQMHAITAISGSGSAYVFYLMNALQQAAIEQGFHSNIAQQLALHTFKGAVALAEQSNIPFNELQQQVTSKNGTTEAAINSFEQHQIAKNLIKGTQIAAKRSHEIQQQMHANTPK